MPVEIHFARTGSIAEAIELLLWETTASLDAALYRLNSPRLAGALKDAAERGVRVRLVLDRAKYKKMKSQITRELLSQAHIRLRLISGRSGRGAKMHHKFAVLDGHTVVTGSYNWTPESEELNYDNLLVLRGRELVKPYAGEFEALWTAAGKSKNP